MLRKIDKLELLKHIVFIVCVGIVSAFTSIVLCLCVNFAYHVNQTFAWTLFFLPLLGVLSLALYKAFKLPYDYSTDTLVEQMRNNDVVSPALAPGIIVGTCLTILGGGAVGKESSAFQAGASVSETLGRAFKLKNCLVDKQDRELYGYAALMGMSATFSALFFAPLGAVFMVLELTRFKNLSLPRFIAMIASAAIAASIAYPFGIGDIIPRVAIPAMTGELVLYTIIAGMACGVLGGIFGRALRFTRKLLKTHFDRPYLTVIVSGLVIVCLVYFLDLRAFEGSGMNLLKHALDGSIGTYDFAIKAGLVFLALAFGFKGGEIMPTLAIGGLLGCTLGQLMGIDPAFMSALGVIGFYVGMSRCPIAGFFLGCEVFGWAIAPFLAIIVICAVMGNWDYGYYGHGLIYEMRKELAQRHANAAGAKAVSANASTEAANGQEKNAKQRSSEN